MTVLGVILTCCDIFAGHGGSTNKDHNGGSLQHTRQLNSQKLRDFASSAENSFGLPLENDFEKFDGQSWIFDGGRKLLSALSKRERAEEVRWKRAASKARDMTRDVDPRIENIPSKYTLFVVSFFIVPSLRV